MPKFCSSLAFFCLLFSSLYADVKLPAFFSDNMVLQQKSNVDFWGFALPGEKVRIKTSWQKRTYSISADASGNWKIQMSTPQAGGPFTIEIKGENKIALKNVLIGEVWLCSGQSNMDMPVKGFYNSPVSNSESLLLNAPNPQIRLFRVARKISSSPLKDVEGSWFEAKAASVNEFSAVAYQFASILNKHLNVPVAVIQSTWGGSPIEAWMNESSLSEVAAKNNLIGGATSTNPHQVSSNLFNGMIAPLVGYNIAGLLWYQGEQNRYNYQDYRSLQPAMVKSWRQLWGMGDWSFFYVQIAPMRYPDNQSHLLPFFREVQSLSENEILNSGMVVSIDAGEEYNIHPANKEIISKRLARLALARTYQLSGINSVAPTYKSIKVSGDSVIVNFSNTPLGLTSFGKKVTQFEISGSDHKFYKATAVIKGNTIIVHSDEVKQPLAVRYAFKDWVVGELYGIDGLPVSAFRSDDW